jgi:hypothetical protein
MRHPTRVTADQTAPPPPPPHTTPPQQDRHVTPNAHAHANARSHATACSSTIHKRSSSNATFVTVTHQTHERWTLAAHRVFAHDTHRKLARLIRLRLTFHPAARTKVASFLKVLGLWLTVTASLDSSAWFTAFA